MQFVAGAGSAVERGAAQLLLDFATLLQLVVELGMRDGEDRQRPDRHGQASTSGSKASTSAISWHACLGKYKGG
ncbi:MAG: hypothetical protein IBX47_01395 [Desulfuromonadales bacterium]|nr:hypothetical protein [Desulfuromonadales bacterium]